MIRALALICILWSTAFSANGEVRAPLTASELTQEISDLRSENKLTRDALEAVRRDQLNYSIEKNILKDAYASNLQTIQLVITIVTAVFAVLGYLGFKGILAIKSDYARELEALRALKLSMETELQKHVVGFSTVKADLDQLAKKNQEQDRRLKALEIMEKAGQLLHQQNFVLALEYVNAGLSLEPQNTKFLDAKSICLLRLGQISEAIEVNKESLAIEAKNPTVIANCAECLLITDRVDEFDSFYKEYKAHLTTVDYGALEQWLFVLRGIVRNDIGAMKAAIQPFASSCSDGATPRITPTWSFQDRHALNCETSTGAAEDPRGGDYRVSGRA